MRGGSTATTPSARRRSSAWSRKMKLSSGVGSRRTQIGWRSTPGEATGAGPDAGLRCSARTRAHPVRGQGLRPTSFDAPPEDRFDRPLPGAADRGRSRGDRVTDFRIDLERARREAKALLRAARAGDPDALRRMRPDREPRLADAQLVVARALGARSWPALVRRAEGVDELLAAC